MAAWTRALFVTLALCLSCSSERERPPIASDSCGPSPCRPPVVSGVSGGPGPSEVRDAGGADAGMRESLVVEFAIAESTDFTQTRPLDFATLDVLLDAGDGQRSRATHSAGSLEFVDPGAAPFWLRIDQTGGAADLMATLLPIAGDASPVTAVLLERRVVEDVADNLTVPVALDPDLGHALFTFRSDALPLQGVRVEVAEGRLAYDSGTLFSDGLEATQERGMAVLLNVPATPFPGGSSEVFVDFDGETRLVEIELAQDAVTVVTLSF